MSRWLRRTAAVAGLGVRRVIGRLRGAAPGRTAACITGVAIAVALLFVVTGLSMGLAASATVESENIDYWIVPDEGGSGSVPLDAEGARLSEVHEVANDLEADDRIEYSSPVVLQPVQVENPATGEREYVIAVGVVSDGDHRRIADMNVTALDETYGYHAGGSYDGAWSGDVIATPGVAESLDIESGDDVRLRNDDREFTIVDINDREMAAGFGEVPAVAMPLAELQSVTGLDAADEADQILVSTDDAAVQEELAGIYPGTQVVSRSGLMGADTTPTNLPLAMALASALVAGGIGVAFVATMMGLELTAGRRELAVLDAVGFSWRTRALVVVSETLTVAALGGVVGVGLGLLATIGVNVGVASAVGIPSIATVSPLLVGYAFVAALVVGVCAAPYPLYLAAKTETLEELTR
ncbi:hypothetical protein JCM17823_10970 [Halorubrum gandharaense]